MSSDNMNTFQVKKVYRPLLFLLCLAVGVFAIAGAAVTTREETGGQLETDEVLRTRLRTARDLFICIIVWSVLGMMTGMAASFSRPPPTRHTEVTHRKEMKEHKTKGVNNNGWEINKHSVDVEKGDETRKQNSLMAQT